MLKMKLTEEFALYPKNNEKPLEAPGAEEGGKPRNRTVNLRAKGGETGQ